mmetsp:Transcript_101998/g.255617  ORF Transcript_101998/g.255617 Transcript_101998/m.255617 type:complete len:588 (-) Transcript_101998:22-1785(-)
MEAHERETVTEAELSISLMLFGFITFTMSLFTLVNDPDEDMQYYTWSVISATISIFVGVLMFVSVNEAVHAGLGDAPQLAHSLADLGQMIFYMILLQALSLYTSGVLEKEPFKKHVTRRWGKKSIAYTIRDQRDHKMSLMKCWAMLIGHMSGFASINLGGTFQHGPLYEQYPMLTFLAVPVMYIFHYTIGSIFECVRIRCLTGVDFIPSTVARRYSLIPQEVAEEMHLAEGRVILMTRYQEQVAESMNEIAVITVSFLFVQATRYQITGVLPNKMGLELEDFIHEGSCSVKLSGVAIFLCILMIICVHVKGWFSPEEVSFARRALRQLIADGERSSAFAMAWVLLCLIRWELARNVVVLGSPNTVKARVITAVGTSTVSFLAIFALDKLADASWTGASTDEVIGNLIQAISILVGFSWEQCFDGGAENLAEMAPVNPAITQLAVASLVGFVVITPWRTYILLIVMRLEDRREDAAEAEGEGVEALDMSADAFASIPLGSFEETKDHLQLRNRSTNASARSTNCSNPRSPLGSNAGVDLRGLGFGSIHIGTPSDPEVRKDAGIVKHVEMKQVDVKPLLAENGSSMAHP